MKEALNFALILTEKHKSYTELISQSNIFSNQKELRKKQTEISNQVIEFLNDLQDLKDVLLLRQELKQQYNELLNYYSKDIYIKINQFQQKLNLLNFEYKFVNSVQLQNNINEKNEAIEIIQRKMNSYYNLIEKQ